MTGTSILTVGAALAGLIAYGIITFSLTVNVVQEYLVSDKCI